MVVLAARFPPGGLLLHGHRPRCRPDERGDAGGGDLQPRQSPDLVGRDLFPDRDHGRVAGADPGLPLAPRARPRGSGAPRWGRTSGAAPLPLDLHPRRLLRGLAAILAGAARALPLSHARRVAVDVPRARAGADLPPHPARPPARPCRPDQRGGAGVRLPADGHRLLHLLLSALDRIAAHGRCLEQPRLVRLRQTATQLVSLLLDFPGLALVVGCLVLGLGLAAGGPPWLTAGQRAATGLVLAGR